MQIREEGGIFSTLQNESHPSPTCLRSKRMLSYNKLSGIKSSSSSVTLKRIGHYLAEICHL